MNRNSLRNRPTPTAPASSAAARIFGLFDVGQQFHRLAVERDRRRVPQAVQPGALELALPLPKPVLFEHDRRRVDDDDAGIAIDDHPVVRADQAAGLARTHHRRDVHAARDDRGVRGAPADIGDEAGEDAALEAASCPPAPRRWPPAPADRRRRSRAASATGARLAAARPRPGHATSHAACARPPAPGRPCARAGSRLPSRRTGAPALRAAPTAPIRRCSAGRRSSCLAAPVSASSCSSIRCTSSSADSSAGASSGRSRCKARQLRGHGVARMAQAIDFILDLVGGDEVVRHVDPAGRHQHGAPDGHAARHRHAEDLDAHASTVAQHCAAARAIQRLIDLRRTCRRSRRRWHPCAACSSGAIGFDFDLGAEARGQHHHAHDALGIDAAAIAAHVHITGEARRPAWSAWPRPAHAGPAYC